MDTLEDVYVDLRHETDDFPACQAHCSTVIRYVSEPQCCMDPKFHDCAREAVWHLDFNCGCTRDVCLLCWDRKYGGARMNEKFRCCTCDSFTSKVINRVPLRRG